MKSGQEMMTFEELAGFAFKKFESSNNIEVTVICTTYNHSGYISDALNSFLEQITSFNFVFNGPVNSNSEWK